MLVQLNCGAVSRSARCATVGALEFEVAGIVATAALYLLTSHPEPQ